MITSLDTRALDRLEDLIAQLSPGARPDYQIFKLKYAMASSVSTVLKEIFKEGDKKQRIPLWMQLEYGMGDDSDKDKGGGRLSKRRPLRIVAEFDTNSILVQGADAAQLRTIKELVEFYDKPEAPDAQSVHQTATFVLQWSKAETVADTIKDLYRDLLSPKDKALSSQQQDQKQRPYVISLYGDDSSGEGEAQKRPRFQGLLSIGIDKVSNTLVVSAPPYLMKEVSKMIKELDDAAKPTDAVSVLKLGPGVNAEKFESAITKLLGDPSKAGAGRGQQNQQGQQGQGGQGDRRRNRDGSNRDRRGN
jgi:type II secretory pathway component GspD/PulD (secretin)